MPALPRQLTIGIALIVAAACSPFGSNAKPSEAAPSGNDAGRGDDASTAEDGDGGSPAPDASTVADGYANAVLLDKPVGYWKLDERAGTPTAADSSGRGHEGTPTGTTFGVSGPMGTTAARFDGTSSSIKLEPEGDFEMSGTNVFSIEAWVSPAQSQASERGYFFAREGSPTGDPTYNAGYGLLLDSQDGFAFEREVLDAPLSAKSTNTAVVPGAFTYVVGTYNGTTLALYVGGAPVANTSGTEGDTLAIPSDENRPAFIGAVSGGTSVVSGFTGALAHVALYDKALTKDQIAAHFAASK
jgi:hypothetical protein